MRLALVLLALGGLARPASAELRSVAFSVRRGHDVGSVAVPGTDSGLGLGASLRVALGGARGAWELGLEGDIAGYSGSADGDPILHLVFSVSRRWDLGRLDAGTRPFLVLGAGFGVQGIVSGGAVFPLRAAAGLALLAGRGVGLDVALYERFAPVYGDGDPALEYVNSLGLEIALRFGR